MRFLATIMLPLLVATTEAANVVAVSIAKNPATHGKIMNPRGLGKRATITESVANNVSSGSYLATVQVGTPAQTLTLALDTGSSDVWVLASDALVCAPQNQFPDEPNACAFGTFDNSSSSTFKDIIPGGFEIQYQDNSGAVGDFFTDDFTFGKATIKALQMGLGSGETNVPLGIMGIGYDADESLLEGESKYPNLIDELVSQGLINIEAYSLYLDSLADSTGSILFGGIDTSKYTGSLISIPVQPDENGTISSFTVSLTNLTVTNGSSTTSPATFSSAIPVILDSGTTLTYLPDALVKPIFTKIGALDESLTSGSVFVDCDINSTGTTFNYQFGGSNGPTISVSMDELLISIPSDEIQSITNGPPPFKNTCQFGLVNGGDGPYLLGDSFLRSAYVVYDLKNNQIGMATTKFDSESSNVVEIPSSASSIPLVSGVATGGSVTQTATGVLGNGPGSGASSTGSSTGSSSVVTISEGGSSTGSASGVTASISSSVSSASSGSVTSASTSSFSSSSTPVSVTSVVSTTVVSSSSKSASGTASTASSSGAGVASVPSFEFGGLVVLTISGFFSLMGGLLFVL